MIRANKVLLYVLQSASEYYPYSGRYQKIPAINFISAFFRKCELNSKNCFFCLCTRQLVVLGTSHLKILPVLAHIPLHIRVAVGAAPRRQFSQLIQDKIARSLDLVDKAIDPKEHIICHFESFISQISIYPTDNHLSSCTHSSPGSLYFITFSVSSSWCLTPGQNIDQKTNFKECESLQ